MESKAPDTSASEDGGVHAKMLQGALQKTAKKCVSSFKLSLFKRKFDTIHKKDPKMLQKLYEGAVSELSSNIQEELSLMFEEENFGELMAKMDELKEQADAKTEDVIAWRPSGDPEADVRAHSHGVHQRHLQQLNRVFQQLQSQNTLLQRNLQKEHDKLAKSHSAMLEHVDTWKTANCLTAEEKQEIKHFLEEKDM